MNYLSLYFLITGLFLLYTGNTLRKKNEKEERKICIQSGTIFLITFLLSFLFGENILYIIILSYLSYIFTKAGTKYNKNYYIIVGMNVVVLWKYIFNTSPPKTSPPKRSSPPKTSPPKRSPPKTSPPKRSPPKTSPLKQVRVLPKFPTVKKQAKFISNTEVSNIMRKNPYIGNQRDIHRYQEEDDVIINRARSISKDDDSDDELSNTGVMKKFQNDPIRQRMLERMRSRR